jgi:hypothetical protein
LKENDMIRPVLVPTRSTLGFRRWAAALLDQQLWCLGRDVACKGNILLSMGFCRYRSPKDDREATLYTTSIPNGGTVWLWGFGAAFTLPGLGSVFVRRYDFSPRLSSRVSFLGEHEADGIAGLYSPVSAGEWRATRELLRGLCEWLAEYEHWIAENHGLEWRVECLARCSKANVVEARELARSWQRAAKKCRQLNASTLKDRVGPWSGVLHTLRRQCSLTYAPIVHRPSTKVTA